MSGSQPFFAAWLAAPPPPAAIVLTAQRVSVVALSVRSSGVVVTGHASGPLAPGLLTPALNAVNVHDPNALATAIKAALDGVSPRVRRAALVLPDTVAKVSLLRFEKVPAKAQDLEQLIRWQMRKAAPFRVEDAQVSWSEGADAQEGGREYLVEMVRRDVVESYERACDAAGVHAGIIDIASSSLVNAVLATQPSASTGDWLVVHTAPDYATLVVVRNGRVIFFRNRSAEAVVHEMDDLVHQTAMYYQDRLGGTTFGRIFLSGASTDVAAGDRVHRQVAERLGVRVEILDVTSGVSIRDRISPGLEFLDTLAPAVGILLRDRPAGRGGARADAGRVA